MSLDLQKMLKKSLGIDRKADSAADEAPPARPELTRALESLTAEYQPEYILPFPVHVYERLVDLGVADRKQALKGEVGNLVPSHSLYRLRAKSASA